MSTETEIQVEIAELGRLTSEQEAILYNIVLRQDELGRQPTNMLLDKLIDSPVYQPMLDREYLTYDVYDHGNEGAPVVASLIATLKGLRYCMLFADEIEPTLKWNAAGVVRG